MTKQKLTRREKSDLVRIIPTVTLINELQRRALAEPDLRGLILHRISEVLSVIACQFGVRIGAEFDDVNRESAADWGLVFSRRAPADSRSDAERPPSIETPASKR